jgi:hypothetical protein
MKVFIQNLNYQFSHQHLYVSLVPVTDLQALSVHLTHIAVVPLTQLIHASD